MYVAEMICRLCLCELVHGFVSIFDEFECHTESEIAKLIAKYFHIELQLDDTVSNKICKSCLKHLNDFHDFWLFIEEKQQTLLKELSNFKCDLIVDELAEAQFFEQEEDVKNVPLYEPSIDTVFPDQVAIETNKLETANNHDVTANESSADEDFYLSNVESTLSSEAETKTPAKKSKKTCIKKVTRNSQGKFTKKTDRKTDPSIDTVFPDQVAIKTNKLETANDHDDTANEYSADEDFYLSNAEFTLSSENETKTPAKKSKKTSKKKLTRNLQGKFTKKTDNNSKFQCKECNKLLADDNSLRNHMYRRHVSKEDLKFECNMCEKKFAKKYVLDGHLLTHRKPDNLITCELCHKGFSTKRSYKAHRKTDHAEELKIICDSCGKRFKHKIGYDVHYKYAHTDLKEHEVQCQVCSLWLKNGRSLERHMYNHRDESSGKEFICNICGIVKYTKKKLTAHKNYHHPIKMHKCTLCNKEFKRLLALEEHMAVHTGQPLYTCKFCPQTFKSNGNMHSHRRRLHQNENVRKSPKPHNV